MPIEIGSVYAVGGRLVRVVDVWRPDGARGGRAPVHYITYEPFGLGETLSDWMPGGWFLNERGKRRCNATEFRRSFTLPRGIPE
jgi:hypothetical protein